MIARDQTMRTPPPVTLRGRPAAATTVIVTTTAVDVDRGPPALARASTICTSPLSCD